METPSANKSSVPLVVQNVLGVIRFSGMLMAVMGIAALGLWVYPQAVGIHPADGVTVLFLILGILFLGLGLPQWFLVWDLTLNRATRRLVRRLGTLGMVNSVEHPFEAFTKVLLFRKRIKSYWRYQVFLYGNPTGKRAEVFMSGQSDEREVALAKAKEVAEYVGLPLDDQSVPR